MHWIRAKEPGTHQWSYYSKASPCWQGIPTAAATSPVVLTQREAPVPRHEGPAHSTTLCSISSLQHSGPHLKMGDQTTGTCSWRKSDILQSSMAKSSGFEPSVLEGWNTALAQQLCCLKASATEFMRAALSSGNLCRPNRSQLTAAASFPAQQLLCSSSLTSHQALASRRQEIALDLKVRQMPNPSPGPMLGESGNVMFRTQMCQYLFPHEKQSKLFFS